MIISHRHKFIFNKTHKTAGTSIEIALSGICGDKDVITPITPEDQKVREELGFRGPQNIHVPITNYSFRELLLSAIYRKRKKYRRHMSCEDIKQNVSKSIWDSYFKFSIVRNPYDRMVSLYYWRGGDKEFGSIYKFLNSDKLNRFHSFEKYSIDGEIAVDKVYRFENLGYFLQDLSQQLKLKEPLKLPDYKAKSHTRKVKDYRDVLDEKSITIIQNLFAREFEHYGYEY